MIENDSYTSGDRILMRLGGVAAILAFALGALIGALGFKYAGYIATVPLAIMLVVVSLAPFFRKVPSPR